MKQANPNSDRTEVFLNQFEYPSQCPDPRSYGFDGSNQYYNLLYVVAKELQPNLIVELGTCTGGSTSYLAAGTSGKVLSIDIEIRPDAKKRLFAFDCVELTQGDTRDPDLVNEVAERGPIDLLFIDTLHTAEQVTAELALFRPLVRLGGLIFFDDIRINPGMSAWWDSLDEDCCENTVLTLSPPSSSGEALACHSLPRKEDLLELPEMHWTGFDVVFR